MSQLLKFALIIYLREYWVIMLIAIAIHDQTSKRNDLMKKWKKHERILQII